MAACRFTISMSPTNHVHSALVFIMSMFGGNNDGSERSVSPTIQQAIHLLDNKAVVCRGKNISSLLWWLMVLHR
jgi:hypothetical protein